VNLAGQRSELTRKVQALELDVAGLEARWQRIVSEIPDIKKQVAARLSQDPVVQEMEKLVQIYATKATKTPDGRMISPNSPEAEQSMIRARIELANRREELSKQAGGSQLDEFNKELTRIVIDQAEKRAQLKIVRTQLDEVQKQLAQALAFDPEAARLRLAQEALDITGRRVAELQARRANLQPPMVTMIGAN
jgi:chromosome segregation ATPase